MCTKKRFCELISLHPKTIYKTSQKERSRSGVKKRGHKDEEVLSGIRAIIKERPTYGYKRVTALYNRECKGKGLSRYNKKGRIYDYNHKAPHSGHDMRSQVEYRKTVNGGNRKWGPIHIHILTIVLTLLEVRAKIFSSQ